MKNYFKDVGISGKVEILVKSLLRALLMSMSVLRTLPKQNAVKIELTTMLLIRT